MELPRRVDYFDGGGSLRLSDDRVEHRRAPPSLPGADLHGRQRSSAVLSSAVLVTDR